MCVCEDRRMQLELVVSVQAAALAAQAGHIRMLERRAYLGEPRLMDLGPGVSR